VDPEICDAKKVCLSDSDILMLAQIEEHPDVRKWAGHAYGGSVEKMHEWFKKSLTELPRSSNEFVVAKINGTVVGFAGIHRFTGNMSHVGEVGVMVHPDHQNKGIGTALLKACIQTAKKGGVERLEADTLAINKAMMKTAQKAGFLVEGIRKKRLKRDNHYYDEALLAISLEYKEHAE